MSARDIQRGGAFFTYLSNQRYRPLVATPEEIGMRDQICGHEGAMAVTRHPNTLRVGNANQYRFVDRRLCIGDQLFQIRVIGLLRVADDWDEALSMIA